MKEFLKKVANIIDNYRFVDKIEFSVKQYEEFEIGYQEPIPWNRTDIIINGTNLIQLLKEYEMIEAQDKKDDIKLAGMYAGIDPTGFAGIKNLFSKNNSNARLLQCSQCFSSLCGTHITCKIKKGFIFTKIYDSEQKPYTGNECCHKETKVKAFWNYSRFRPIKLWTWQLNKALKVISEN